VPPLSSKLEKLYAKVTLTAAEAKSNGELLRLFYLGYEELEKKKIQNNHYSYRVL